MSDSDEILYPIAESFYSVQGEGVWSGAAAYFVRFFGCSVKCEWCDSKYAWNGSPTRTASVSDLVLEVVKSGAERVVLTGGEPCMYDLNPLVDAFLENGIKTHLETSGAFEISASDKISWVALSPKLFSPPRESSFARADEIKLIVSSECDIDAYLDFLPLAKNAKCVWLHPEWSRHSDKKLLEFITEFVKARGGIFRAGWQMHKNYFVR